MAINTKNRNDLKSYFVKNAIPTQGNFADLIDAQLNQSDDGVFKLPGEPLSVVAAGGDQKRVLRLYSTYPAPNPDWLISLNPRQNPTDAASNRPGFGITNAAGATRLFIDAATGNLGVGTNTPAAKLTVKDGDVRIEGGSSRRLVLVSDERWAGIDLVCRDPNGSPYIDFTHGELDNPNYGIRLFSPDNKTLAVSTGANDAVFQVTGDLKYGGTQDKLDVAEQFSGVVRAVQLLFGHSTRYGQNRPGEQGRALGDGTNELIINCGPDWQRTVVHGPLYATGHLGAGAAPEYPLDIRLPGGANGFNRFVVTTTGAWGDTNAQHVTIGTAATGLMIWNPHVPWMAGEDNRASIRYGRTGGTAGGTWWDAGLRPDGSFSFKAYDSGTTSGTDLLTISKTGEVTMSGTKVNVIGPAVFAGQVKASAGLVFNGAVAHIDADGAFYRNTDGQVYLTVDDNFYIRRIGRATPLAHFDGSGNLYVSGASLRIGDWTLESAGAHFYIKRGTQTVARFSIGNDRFNVFRDVNGIGPYFYFNQHGNYSVHTGTSTPP